MTEHQQPSLTPSLSYPLPTSPSSQSNNPAALTVKKRAMSMPSSPPPVFSPLEGARSPSYSSENNKKSHKEALPPSGTLFFLSSLI